MRSIFPRPLTILITGFFIATLFSAGVSFGAPKGRWGIPQASKTSKGAPKVGPKVIYKTKEKDKGLIKQAPQVPIDTVVKTPQQSSGKSGKGSGRFSPLNIFNNPNLKYFIFQGLPNSPEFLEVLDKLFVLNVENFMSPLDYWIVTRIDPAELQGVGQLVVLEGSMNWCEVGKESSLPGKQDLKDQCKNGAAPDIAGNPMSGSPAASLGLWTTAGCGAGGGSGISGSVGGFGGSSNRKAHLTPGEQNCSSVSQTPSGMTPSSPSDGGNRLPGSDELRNAINDRACKKKKGGALEAALDKQSQRMEDGGGGGFGLGKPVQSWSDESGNYVVYDSGIVDVYDDDGNLIDRFGGEDPGRQHAFAPEPVTASPPKPEPKPKEEPKPQPITTPEKTPNPMDDGGGGWVYAPKGTTPMEKIQQRIYPSPEGSVGAGRIPGVSPFAKRGQLINPGLLADNANFFFFDPCTGGFGRFGGGKVLTSEGGARDPCTLINPGDNPSLCGGRSPSGPPAPPGYGPQPSRGPTMTHQLPKPPVPSGPVQQQLQQRLEQRLPKMLKKQP